jgi:O-antigen/teichoic acid export membrane protein
MVYNAKNGPFKRFGKAENSQFLSIVIQIFTMAIAIFTVFFISIQHGLEQVGTFVFFSTVQQILAFMATLGLSSFSIRVLNRTKYPRLVLFLLILHAGAVLCVFLVFIVTTALFGDYLGEYSTLCLVAIWLGLVRYMLEDVCAGLQRFARGSFINLVETSVRLFAATIVEFDSGGDVLVVLILSTASAIGLCAYPILSRFPIRQSIRFPARYKTVFYRKSAIMYSSHLSGLAQGRFAIVVGPYFLSASQMGAFVILLNLSEVALRAGGLINRYIFSIASIRQASAERVDPSLVIRIVILCSVFLAMLLFFIFPYIDIFMYRNKLNLFHLEFLILCIYSISFLYFNLSSNLLYGAGKSLEVLYATLLGFFISLVILAASWRDASVTLLCISMTVGIIVSGLLNKRAVRICQFNTKAR